MSACLFGNKLVQFLYGYNLFVVITNLCARFAKQIGHYSNLALFGIHEGVKGKYK